MVKDNNQSLDGIEQVESALTKTEQYIEENQKSLTIIILAIVAIVGAYLGYERFYVAPQESEAQSQMYVAEQYFEKDSFRLALNGDGNYLGFNEIVENYGITKSANLAHYYAGICNLQLGNYQDAIEALGKFSSNDEMLAPVAVGAIGDAYLELGKLEEAASHYLQAVKLSENKFTAPIYLLKAGQTFEMSKSYKKALSAYETINSDYPKTTEGRQVEKFITRVSMKMNK